MPQAIYTFKVSESFFRVAVDAVRQRSLETRSFESVSSAAFSGLGRFLKDSTPCATIERARAVDEAGDIRVTLKVREPEREIFQEARSRIANSTSEPASTRFTLALALLVANEGTIPQS